MRTIHSLFRRRRLEAELDAELRAGLDVMVQQHMARGMTAAEARRAALLEFEGVEQVKESVRDEYFGIAIHSALQDVRYACRTLRKSPGFTAVALLTLVLGIGANTAIFSVVYAALLRPLPYNHPEQLALIWSNFEKSGAFRAPTSPIAMREIKQRNRLLADVAAIWVGTGTFTGDSDPEQVKVASVTPNFLAMLGVRPALGRVFTPDEQFGGRPALVLSYGFWRRRFGADPNIVGKKVAFQNGSPTVVGVLPENFQLYFAPESNVPMDVQAFAPFSSNIYRQPLTLYYLRVVARLKPGVGAVQAQQDLDGVASQMRAAYTDFGAENLKLELAPMQRDAVRDIRPGLIALCAGAGLVLLIACVNVANLLLGRASDRRKEMAVRAALGASHGRILRQLLLEGLVLCAAAAVLGVAAGWIGVRALLSLRPDYLLRIQDVGLHWPVLVFVAAVSLGSVLLFGLAPAFESIRVNLVAALCERGRASHTPVQQRLSALLIVGEISLGFVLVIGAGLMIRTLAHIQAVRPGFEAQHLLTFQMGLPSSPTSGAQAEFVKNWESTLASLPGVESVGATSHLPLDDYPNWYSPYRPEGVSENQGAALVADYRSITPGYFRAMGTRLLEGRFFDEQDRAGARRVVVVDELLARSAWPGQVAVGQRIEAEHTGNTGFTRDWAEVIGVVEHVRNHSLSRQVRPEIYVPWEQSPRSPLSFAVRANGDPLLLAPAIRKEIKQRGLKLAISKVRVMTGYVDSATAPASFTALLAGIFAGLALLLAAIGIFGVVSYSVSRRSHELGVRMALGATARDVVRMVMREGLVLASIGILLGVGGALGVSHWLKELLYGVSAVDPLTYGIAFAALSAAALLGCWRPASRAARANPVDVIRAE